MMLADQMYIYPVLDRREFIVQDYSSNMKIVNSTIMTIHDKEMERGAKWMTV